MSELDEAVTARSRFPGPPGWLPGRSWGWWGHWVARVDAVAVVQRFADRDGLSCGRVRFRRGGAVLVDEVEVNPLRLRRRGRNGASAGYGVRWRDP